MKENSWEMAKENEKVVKYFLLRSGNKITVNNIQCIHFADACNAVNNLIGYIKGGTYGTDLCG